MCVAVCLSTPYAELKVIFLAKLASSINANVNIQRAHVYLGSAVLPQMIKVSMLHKQQKLQYTGCYW